MRFLALVLSMLLPASPALAQSDAEVLEILKARIDQYRWSVGMVVGIIEPSGRRVIAYGHPAKDEPRVVDGDTVFEIGSITKVFTSLLLADSALRKEVALNDTLQQYLPDGIHIPERGDRSITLLDLSTHTSGLPRTPFNLPSEDLDNPYTGYTEELLYKFLSTYELKRDIGSRFEYSNLGAGLLGLALQRPTGKSYELLLRDRIIGPLKLESTGISVSADMSRRLAKGYGLGLRPMPAPWDMPTLSAAGALRSSANDMLTLLSATLG
jgi:serine-type D-Ala-D-Ala carboxypeptidase/endopeptidase